MLLYGIRASAVIPAGSDRGLYFSSVAVSRLFQDRDSGQVLTFLIFYCRAFWVNMEVNFFVNYVLLYYS